MSAKAESRKAEKMYRTVNLHADDAAVLTRIAGDLQRQSGKAVSIAYAVTWILRESDIPALQEFIAQYEDE